MKRVISIILTVIMLVGVIAVPGVTASAATVGTGALVTIGSYPQTLVTDSLLLAKLKAQWLSWTYYDYYCDGKKGYYMKYSDVTLSGERYRAVTFTHYRPWMSGYSVSNDYTYQDENGYEPDKVYWFKYEPIVWRILDPLQGLLMAENLLDSQPFHNVCYHKDNEGVYYGDQSYTHYASNWAYSSLRSWMNDVFYDTAFSAEKSYIKTTSLTTPSSTSSEYDADPTKDKVFLLSSADVFNPSYGFSSDNGSGADTNRIAYGTDYARCQGLYAENYYYSGASSWWLRTPFDDVVECVRYTDLFDDPNNAESTYLGVRPALYVDNLQSAISAGLIKITDSNNLVINRPSDKDSDSWHTASGKVQAPGKKFNCNYNYSDGLFALSSSEYHQDLAMTSLAFEFAACVSDNFEETDPPLADEFFKNIGFTAYKSYGYDDNKTKQDMNGVACIVGCKEITVNGEPAFILGCAVRGAGYMEEWGGNFIMGTDTQHEGFYKASETVLDHMNMFIKENIPLESKVYFWVTGYSRAAAVANITAARLNKGVKDYGYIRLMKPNKSNVFCYTFETPKCTTDGSAASEDYDNIFNMINPIDIVPKVPPCYGDFKFTRYGQSYYFPTRETTSGYGGLLKRYKNKYQEICPEGYVYSEEFEFTNLKGEKNDKIGQMTFGNNLVKYITTGALKDRKNYVDNYQDSLSTLIAIVAGGYHTNENDADSLIKSLKEDIQAYMNEHETKIGLITNAILTDDLCDILSDNLHRYTELSNEEINVLVSQVKPILLTLLRHPNYSSTAYNSINKKVGYKDLKDNRASAVIYFPHTDTVLTAWMALLGDFSEAEFNKYVKNRSKQNDIKINCPVDVNVYDENNELVASIINDEVQDCGENWLVCYIDEDGQKIVTLPEDGRYRVEVTAREDCDVSVSSVIIDCDTVETIGVENYYSIDVKADETVMLSADEVAEDDALTRDIEVSKGEKTIRTSETVTDTGEITCIVTAESDTGAVVGGGEYDKGEFALLRALPEEGQKFDGWYIDGELVCADAEYRFCVKKDVTVTGKFSAAFTPGDIDGNGQILADDARLALRASAKLEELNEVQLLAADVDGNNQVLADDARQILRFSAKLQSAFKKA